MVVESEDYKLEILEYAVNQSIDCLLPKNFEDALSVILYQSNEFVWRVATEIYSKSGHQVDFLFIRNFLNLRIDPLRKEIAKKARIAEREKLERELKEEKQKKLQESEIFIRIKNMIVGQLEVEKEEIKLDTLFEYLIPESYNRNRMKRQNSWCSSSSLIDDRELNSIELVMAVEEEFDIEISDEESENLLSWNVGQLVDLIVQKV